MGVAELKEALGLLRSIPALWIPGLITGIFAAGIWIIYHFEGSFFATRMVLFCSLISVFFIAGSYAVVRNGHGSPRELVQEGMTSFFRVLLPLLVIVFSTLLLAALVMITLSFAGVPATPEFLGVFTFCILVPVVFLSAFSDTAAVFEGLHIFDAIRRSIELVTTRAGRVLGFFLMSAALFFGITFSLMIVWEAALYSKLEPLTRFNESQIAAFTPEQLIGMIGTEGTIVTAACLFLGFLLLLPILTAYKACFFRSLIGELSPAPISISPRTDGEFDSKGRWYKY